MIYKIKELPRAHVFQLMVVGARGLHGESATWSVVLVRGTAREPVPGLNPIVEVTAVMVKLLRKRSAQKSAVRVSSAFVM